MTLTTLVLVAMLVAVFAIAGRVWWTIRLAERRQRKLRGSREPREPRSEP